MQSISSITSGLLTLSVHEALTFDADIALHPEIFSGPSSGGMQGKHSRDPSFANAAVSGIQSRHSRDASYSSAVSSAGAGIARASPPPMGPINPSVASSLSNHNNDEESSIITSLQTSPRLIKQVPSSVPSTPSSPLYGLQLTDQTPSTENNYKLQPGDLIEIQVWEQKPAGKSDFNRSVSTNMNNLNQLLSTNEGDVIMGLSPSMIENQQSSQQPPSHHLSEQRRPTKPPTIPRASLTTSPKNTAGYLRPRGSPPELPPFEPSSPHLRMIQPNLFKRDSMFSTASDLNSDEGKEAESNKTVSALEATSDGGENETSRLDRTTVEGHQKTEAISPRPFPSLDSSCSKIFSSAFQNMEDYQTPSFQKAPHVLDVLSTTHNLRLKLVMAVTEKSLSALKSTSRVQVSLLKQGMVFSSTILLFV